MKPDPLSPSRPETLRALVGKFREREAYAHGRQQDLRGTDLCAWWQGVRDQAVEAGARASEVAIAPRETSGGRNESWRTVVGLSCRSLLFSVRSEEREP